MNEQEIIDQHFNTWKHYGLQTGRVDRQAVTSHVEQLYTVAGFQKPLVVFAPSPLTMVYGFGAAYALREHGKPMQPAFEIFEMVAFPNETVEDYKTRVKAKCHAIAGDDGLDCASQWESVYQGGNTWVSSAMYISTLKEIGDLSGKEFDDYQSYEALAKTSGPRLVVDGLCVVCEFPKMFKVTDELVPHSDIGPAYEWVDGFRLYLVRGMTVPEKWVEQRATLTASEVLSETNTELRAIGCELCGWGKIEAELGAVMIDDSGSDDIGYLLEMNLPGIDKPVKFLKALCPRNGWIYEGVEDVSDVDGLPILTALHAQAWRVGDPLSEYVHPEVRS